MRFILIGVIYGLCSIALANEPAQSAAPGHGAPAAAAGHGDDHNEEASDAKKIQIRSIPDEVHLPSTLFDTLETAGRGEDRLKVNKIPFELMEVSVVLREKNEGVLGEKEYLVQFPKGGGSLDISQFTTNKSGTFYLAVQYPNPSKETDKVYFVSKAKRRKIGDEVWGSGCNKYFDLTNFFFKTGFKEGIKANTTDFRHLSLLGGSFVVAVNDGKKVRTAQVRVFDSKNPQFFCEK